MNVAVMPHRSCWLGFCYLKLPLLYKETYFQDTVFFTRINRITYYYILYVTMDLIACFALLDVFA